MASTIKVDQIQLSDGSTPTAADLGIDIGDTGKVLQVVSTEVDGAANYSNSARDSWQNLISLSITPSSVSSKIMIMASVSVGSDYGVVFRVVKDGNPIDNLRGDTGDLRTPISFSTVPYASNNNETSTASFTGVDTAGTTSELTYTIQGGSRAPETWTFNKALNSASTNGYRNLSVTTLTLMEIAQ